MAKVTELVARLAAPAVEAAGCELWDVEYVREAGSWFLRLYIDKAGGEGTAAFASRAIEVYCKKA